jgi:hypothetical protein
MRSILTGLLFILVTVPAAAQSTKVKDLFDASTGIGVTLPESWNFAIDDVSFTAAIDDKTALIVLIAAEKSFKEEVLELEETLGQEVFRDVKVDSAVILMGENRGQFEEVIAAKGTAVHRKDGKPVEFECLLIKSGEKGGLVLGAWKDPKNAQTVHDILEGIYVRPPQEGRRARADEPQDRGEHQPSRRLDGASQEARPRGVQP